MLAGACDLIALKDTVAGTHARRMFNAALGTSLEVSGRTLAYEPARRAEVVRAARPRLGRRADPAEFDWWFDGNPVGPRRRARARRTGRVVGVLGASHFRAVVGGERRSRRCRSGPSTDPEYQGRGIFQRLERRDERAARETGAALELGFTNELARPDLPREARLARRSPGCGSGRARSCRAAARDDGERLERFGPEQEDAYRALRDRLPSHFVRDAAYLNWRYADSPRAYTLLASPSGYAVVGRKQFRGIDVGVRRRPRRPDVPRDAPAAPALRARGAWRARAARAAPRRARERATSSAGFVPTPRDDPPDRQALDQGALPLGPKAWHFALGDTDFF